MKGVENVGKQILLDLKETGRCGKSSSDLLCQFTRDLESIQQSVNE